MYFELCVDNLNFEFQINHFKCGVIGTVDMIVDDSVVVNSDGTFQVVTDVIVDVPDLDRGPESARGFYFFGWACEGKRQR